jgi:hypothetical protein
MAEPAELTRDVTALAGRLESLATALESGFGARLSAIRQTGRDLADLHGFVDAQVLSVPYAFISFALASIATYAVIRVVHWAVSHWAGPVGGWRKMVMLGAASLLGLVLMFAATRILVPHEGLRSLLRLWVLATVLGVLADIALKSLLQIPIPWAMS